MRFLESAKQDLVFGKGTFVKNSCWSLPQPKQTCRSMCFFPPHD